MSQDKRARLKQWLESGEARLQPLTLPQRELWEASPVPPGDVSNHIACLIHVRGLITPNDGLAAVQRVIARQEALRISFLPGKERPLQMLRASSDATFNFRELAEGERSDEAVEEIARQIFRQPFDMVLGPLYRIEMLRRSIDDHILVFAIHHAVADGWTLGVFVQDLCGAYLQGVMGAHGPLPAVAQTYADWGAAERAFWQPAQIDARAEFWKKYLGGARRFWTSPDRPGTASIIPERWVSEIPAELGRAARDLARKSGTTLYSTLLTAFQMAVSLWTGEDDIVVGSPVANRNKPASRETMGYYAGIVPIRGQVVRDRTCAEALTSVYHSSVDAFGNAIPFVELARLMGESAAPGYNPLFEIRFALQNHPVPDVALPGLSAKLRMRSTGTPRFEIACELTEMGDPIEVAWLYRTQRFPREEIEKLDGLFQHILSGICRAPETAVGTLLNSNIR